MSQREEAMATRDAILKGEYRAEVLREAIAALRENRAYTGKRAIERPVSMREYVIDEPSITRARPNHLSDRPRVTTNLNPSTMKSLEEISLHSGLSKAELLRGLITDVVGPNGLNPVKRDLVARKSEVIFFSRLFISALEDALEYDPKRHHNQPPPPLRLEDENYLDEIRLLVSELKRLNTNLEAAATLTVSPAGSKAAPTRTPAKRKAVEKSAIDVSKHINTFLNKYSSALGTGAAALTIGTAGALLYQLGVPLDFLKHLRR
jgi:hypothetical protein